MKQYLKIIVLSIVICNILCQWPKVENIKKSRSLPSLEVKIHPPDVFQPKVQELIKQLEEKREKSEKDWMRQLEAAYNQELQGAAETLSIFDDNNLLLKSVEYALNPPLVLMTNNNIEVINPSDVKKKKICIDTPSFKEISNIKMNDLQKDTMKILVEEDKKIEKLRGAKVNIIMDEMASGKIQEDQKNSEGENKNNNINGNNSELMIKKKSNSDEKSFVMNIKGNQKNENNSQNNFNSPFGTDGPIDLNMDFPVFGFMETKANIALMQNSNSKFTKPISVKMKLPSEPDSKIKSEIENIESKRSSFEANLFEKAKQEFQLITALTVSELQKHLNHEMLPFFVISRNALEGIGNIVSANIPSGKTGRFLQIDQSELQEKFPHLEIAKDQEALNKYVYSKILNLFSENPELDTDNLITKKKGNNSEQNPTQADQSENNTEGSDIFNNILNFNYQKCVEMARSLKHLNCDEKLQDYLTLKKHLRTSFLQQGGGGGGDDLINVKFSSNDEPYPTIEKIVAQMMTRRDLAEKFERLKILEFETHLQKAENEMIQDMLHDRIYKIMALYGPAVEGIKEHIR